MKLHLPSGLRKATIALLIGAAAVAPAHALTQNGVTYVRDSAYKLTGTVEDADGTETFVSITGNRYFDSITVGDNDDDASGFAQFDGHVLSNGAVTIHSDSFAQVIEGYSFDATGQTVTIGDAGEDLKKMTPVASSTYTQPVYGGVLSFYSAGPDHSGPVSTLRVGSLQTYSGAYVNDVKTFIVDGSIDAAREATSSGDMDVRRNSDANGYILTDISGNDITIKKGDFSLDTEPTPFDMSSGDTMTTLDPDKMNTGDYGYVKSLSIGSEGASTAKATNDLQVVNGVTVGADSALDMNGHALETSSLSGKATKVSALKVGTFEANEVVADFEAEDGTKAAARNFQAKLIDTTAEASVTGGTMDVTGAEGIYTVSSATGTVNLEKGDFAFGTGVETVNVNDATLTINDVVSGTVNMTGAGEVKLNGNEYTGLRLEGNGMGALTLESTVAAVNGVNNFAVVNLVVDGWDMGATGVTLSQAVLNNFTLNVDFATWNAEAEFELNDQMTLLSGLSEASLKGFTVNLSEATTFGLSGLAAQGYTIGVEVVANESTGKYDVVAKVVPEPTTATLSLLALAGLAARRRRK